MIFYKNKETLAFDELETAISQLIASSESVKNATHRGGVEMNPCLESKPFSEIPLAQNGLGLAHVGVRAFTVEARGKSLFEELEYLAADFDHEARWPRKSFTFIHARETDVLPDGGLEVNLGVRYQKDRWKGFAKISPVFDGGDNRIQDDRLDEVLVEISEWATSLGLASDKAEPLSKSFKNDNDVGFLRRIEFDDIDEVLTSFKRGLEKPKTIWSKLSVFPDSLHSVNGRAYYDRFSSHDSGMTFRSRDFVNIADFRKLGDYKRLCAMAETSSDVFVPIVDFVLPAGEAGTAFFRIRKGNGKKQLFDLYLMVDHGMKRKALEEVIGISLTKTRFQKTDGITVLDPLLSVYVSAPNS